MIRFVEGDDIFAVDADIYVITVNCVGVMGAGLAKSFRDRHPALYQQYRKDCRKGDIRIGTCQLYDGPDEKRYLMFPTKDTWREPSLQLYIGQGLDWLIEASAQWLDPAAHIVMSPLGCHNGGLSFHEVSLMIERAAQDIINPITVVYPWYQLPHPSLMT